MGCRVNGPGETDDADLGLWCGPRAVNLKRGGEKLGAFGYDEVLVRLKDELDRIIASRASRTGAGVLRILHTMLRVGDLERSLAFYTGPLSMKLLRKHDFPGGRFTLAFVGYGDESEIRDARADTQLGHEPLRDRHRLRARRDRRRGHLRRPARACARRASRSRASPARCSTARP